MSGFNTLCDWGRNMSYVFVVCSAHFSGKLLKCLPLPLSFMLVLTCPFTPLGDAAVVVNSVLFRCMFSAVGPGQVGCTGPGKRGKWHIAGGQCGYS